MIRQRNSTPLTKHHKSLLLTWCILTCLRTATQLSTSKDWDFPFTLSTNTTNSCRRLTEIAIIYMISKQHRRKATRRMQMECRACLLWWWPEAYHTCGKLWGGERIPREKLGSRMLILLPQCPLTSQPKLQLSPGYLPASCEIHSLMQHEKNTTYLQKLSSICDTMVHQ